MWQRFTAKICNPLPRAAVIDPDDPVTWGEPTMAHQNIPMQTNVPIILRTFNPLTNHTPQVGDFFDSHRVFLDPGPTPNSSATKLWSQLNAIQQFNVTNQGYGTQFTMWEVVQLLGSPTPSGSWSRRKWPFCTQGVEFQCHPITPFSPAYCSQHAPGTNPLAIHSTHGACISSVLCDPPSTGNLSCLQCSGLATFGVVGTECTTGNVYHYPDTKLNGGVMPATIVGQTIRPIGSPGSGNQPCAPGLGYYTITVTSVTTPPVPLPGSPSQCADMEIASCYDAYNCDGPPPPNGVGTWGCQSAPFASATFTGATALADCTALCQESWNCDPSNWSCYIPNSWSTGIGTLGTYATQPACNTACQPVYDTYNCDGPPPGGTWNCSIAPGQTGTFVGPNAAALCAALCKESYDCDGPPSWNCIQPNSWSTGIGGLGLYIPPNALTDCTSLCQESYDCDVVLQPPLPALYSCNQPNSWLTGIGTLGTYTNPGILGAWTDCTNNCQESYDCSGYPNYTCNTTPVGTTGAYTGVNAFQDCLGDCLPTYACSGAHPVSSLGGATIGIWNCFDPWVGSGGGGMGGGQFTGPTAQADCLADCNAPPDRYNCSGMVSDWIFGTPTQPFTCYPVPAGSPLSPGSYATLPLCQAACILPETWNCDLPWTQPPTVYGTCSDPGDGSGSYWTEQACLDACTNLPADDDETHPDRWNCESKWVIDNNGLSNLIHSCIPVLWPNGDYATEQLCEEVCPPCELCCCEPASIFPHTGSYTCIPGTEVMLAASHDPCDCHYFSPIADFEPCVEDTGVEWGYDCPSTGPPCIGLIAGGAYTPTNAALNINPLTGVNYDNSFPGALAHCTDSCIATPLCQRIRSCPCGWTNQPGTIPGSIDCLSPQPVPNLPQTRMPAIEKCIQFNTVPFVPVIGDVWTYPSSWLGWTWTKVVVVDVSGTLATIITGQTRTIC